MRGIKILIFPYSGSPKKVKSERMCVLRLTASSFFPIQLVFSDCKVSWVALFLF